MNARGMRVRLMQTMAAVAAAGMISGCGSNYRPVVTPINPSGPAAQPQSLAVVISSPSPATSAPGVATIIDYSGDSIVAQSPIGPAPIAFSLDANGVTGYTVNSDGTLTNFPASNQLQQKNITFSTLPASAQSVGLFSPSAGLWVADLNGNVVDSLTGSPETFKLAIPVAPTPVAVVGLGTLGQHNYSISLNNTSTPAGSALAYDTTCNLSPSTATQTGEADSLETATFTVSARLPLGKCPVYGIQSPDGRRLFVLNRGSDTISVINSQLNTLDACTPFTNQNGQPVTCHPCLPLSASAVGTDNPTAPPGSTTGSCLEQAGSNLQTSGLAGPVYGEYIPATQELIVSNYDGNTISLIDVSLDQYGNDSPTFGTTYTIPVGVNPASVTALADGTRAYTANQTDGTVTIVNLNSHTVEKTLTVTGNPRTVVSTENSLFGKVYVASPNSPYLTIIRTDEDIIDTTVLVQGNIVDVRVSTQNGSSGNANTTSRRPGAGQPCYLPPALETATYGAAYTIANCQTLPPPPQ
jgi:DNA-binding beta-propeller fold protein YncE